MTEIWQKYQGSTPQRVKLIDAFMGFLVLVGGLQFLYCVLVGNYVSFFIFLIWWNLGFSWAELQGPSRIRMGGERASK